MEEYRIKMRFSIGIAPWRQWSRLMPKIEPLVYSRPIKEIIYILKKIGFTKTIQLWMAERSLVK